MLVLITFQLTHFVTWNWFHFNFQLDESLKISSFWMGLFGSNSLYFTLFHVQYAGIYMILIANPTSKCSYFWNNVCLNNGWASFLGWVFHLDYHLIYRTRFSFLDLNYILILINITYSFYSCDCLCIVSNFFWLMSLQQYHH